jgi:hypothetical protein
MVSLWVASAWIAEESLAYCDVKKNRERGKGRKQRRIKITQRREFRRGSRRRKSAAG